MDWQASSGTLGLRAFMLFHKQCRFLLDPPGTVGRRQRSDRWIYMNVVNEASRQSVRVSGYVRPGIAKMKQPEKYRKNFSAPRVTISFKSSLRLTDSINGIRECENRKARLHTVGLILVSELVQSSNRIV